MDNSLVRLEGISTFYQMTPEDLENSGCGIFKVSKMIGLFDRMINAGVVDAYSFAEGWYMITSGLDDPATVAEVLGREHDGDYEADALLDYTFELSYAVYDHLMDATKGLEAP